MGDEEGQCTRCGGYVDPHDHYHKDGWVYCRGCWAEDDGLRK